jgi:hypothetical protein
MLPLIVLLWWVELVLMLHALHRSNGYALAIGAMVPIALIIAATFAAAAAFGVGAMLFALVALLGGGV